MMAVEEQDQEEDIGEEKDYGVHEDDIYSIFAYHDIKEFRRTVNELAADGYRLVAHSIATGQPSPLTGIADTVFSAVMIRPDIPQRE